MEKRKQSKTCPETDMPAAGTAKERKMPERLMHLLFLLCGITAVAAVLLISIYLIVSGLPAIGKIGLIKFLFGKVWAPTAAQPSYGILPFILTSIYGTAGALVLGVPMGLMTAIFLAKAAPPRLAAVIRAAVQLLAGIPSVVYGLVGMIVLVPGIRNLFGLSSGATLGGNPGADGDDSALYCQCVRDCAAGCASGI